MAVQLPRPRPTLDMSTQYWTSRGFAVVDVNYGGSTGYGRDYREQLHEQWGIVDVEDCQAAARWLVERDRVDPNRLCITGGSAGGFTTLAALAFGDTFSVGASHFGIADLEALATETHKFESRYLDGLIGPYPQEVERYHARSPIHHLEGFDRPLIVLQGLEDEVVPPAKAEMIVSALPGQGCRSGLRAVRRRATRLPTGREHATRARQRAFVSRTGAALRTSRCRGNRAGTDHQSLGAIGDRFYLDEEIGDRGPATIRYVDAGRGSANSDCRTSATAFRHSRDVT